VTLYGLARPFLFSLDPEDAHALALRLAGLVVPRQFHCPVRAMGLEFPNPVGLAAGLDKDAAHIDALARMGFGFLEVGTVTPLPQPGNAKPRLFRLPEANALINRLGFNNVGVDTFLENVARARFRGILGINIGRNTATPPERAVDDYEFCLEKVYGAASYITINVSSPNTAGLRSLQEKDSLETLLQRLVSRREELSARHGKRVPLVLKIAPDLDTDAIRAIAEAVRRHGIEGVAGGLSGAPILRRSTAVLRELRALLPDITLIGAGGILSAADAAEKRAAGATLVQLYTGLIYRGPNLVGECVSAYRAAKVGYLTP